MIYEGLVCFTLVVSAQVLLVRTIADRLAAISGDKVVSPRA